MGRKAYKSFSQPERQLPDERMLHTPQQSSPNGASRNSGKQQNQASAQEQTKSAGPHMLREVAQMTVQSFPSSQEAMNAALEVIGRFLACQTLFIGRVGENAPGKMSANCNEDVAQRTLKIMEARNRGTSIPAVGAEGALSRTYCQTVWRTRQPLIVEDSSQHPFYQRLPTTEEYNIGFYIGVPLIYSDGRVYGTLCAQDPHPRVLSDRPEALELMQIVARFLISYIEREELTTQLHAAEQAQAELARKERQARAEADSRVRELEAVFEAMGDGLVVSDLQGQFQMNTAAQNMSLIPFARGNLQWVAEQQAKEPLAWDEDGQPLAVECWPIHRVLHGEHLTAARAVNIQSLNKAGEKRYLNISGTPIYDRQQQINGAVLVFRDVTERFLLERQTQDLNRRFNEFLSIASHELKGPLTTIQGNIQFAQRILRRVLSRRSGAQEATFSLLEKIQRYLERAESRVHMQNRLASDLIDVSRIRAGKLELHMECCDMGQIVSESVEDQRQVTQERIITLDLPTERIPIQGDADRLGQVMSNYLTNALKYSASDKPVGVAVTLESATVRVTVSDCGPGLTLEEQKNVWERFYRARDVRVLSGSGIGLGLGLHICKTIVEQHGGGVGLDSIPGQGSRFWFTLPLYLESTSRGEQFIPHHPEPGT